jgi:hypothetical protein
MQRRVEISIEISVHYDHPADPVNFSQEFEAQGTVPELASQLKKELRNIVRHELAAAGMMPAAFHLCYWLDDDWVALNSGE